MPREIVCRTRALSFSQYTELTTDVRSVDLILLCSLNFLKLDEPRSLFRFGNIIMKFCSRSSGTFRILENVKTVVFTFTYERDSFLEVFVSLTRKTDDNVTRQRQ